MIESSLAINSADVAGHYDDLDDYYRRLWGEHLHHGLWETGSETPLEAIENLIETVARPLNLPSGSMVCDVGCGYGGTSRYLAEHRGFRMTGLTISQQQFDYACRQADGSENPRYLLRNWETNELAANSFDGLVSIECVSHVVNKDHYFQEIYRVLKPGHRACITAWLANEDSGTIAKNWLLEPICREGRLPSMGSPADYRALAERAGLRMVDYEDVTSKVRKTWAICLWRVITFVCFTREGWRFLFSAKSRHAIFIFSVARILIAYYLGSMRYGIFQFEKPLA